MVPMDSISALLYVMLWRRSVNVAYLIIRHAQKCCYITSSLTSWDHSHLSWDFRSNMGPWDFSSLIHLLEGKDAYCVVNRAAMHEMRILRTQYHVENIPDQKDNYTCSRSNPSSFEWCWHFLSQRIVCRQMIHRGSSFSFVSILFINP